MKLKILSLVSVLSVIFIAAVIWRMNHFIREDRTSWAQAQMRTQISSLQQTTQSMIHDLQLRAPLLQVPQRDKIFWSSMDPFKAVAWVRDLNNPTLENVSIKDGTGLDDTNLATAMKDLQGKELAKGKFLLVPWKDSQNRNWLMVVWPWSENRKLILWTGAEYLQGLLETHKGTIAKLSFVNESGQVLAHSQMEYFGTRVTDQYLFKDLKSSGALQGGGSFKDSSGEDFQGYYQASQNTNLVVMAAVSYNELLADKNKVWASFLFFGLGLVLLTLGGVSFLNFSHPSEGGEAQRPLPPMPLPKTKPGLPTRSDVASPSAPPQENRQELFKKIAGSLGHEMRSPLARILGFSQLILETEKDKTLAEHAKSILREARSAREVLEKLFNFAQEKETTMVMMKPEDSARGLIQRLMPELQKRNIQLIQKFTDTKEIAIDTNLFEKSLDAILQNSMEATARNLKREINFTIQPSLTGVEIIIQDNGEGISADNLSRVFDPFFTTRTFTNHLGLGLSAAYGVIKQHGGDINVESEKGQGTKVTIHLPDQLNVKNLFKEATSAKMTSSEARHSPADVEIEHLLDFHESEEVQETAVTLDDDKTIAVPSPEKAKAAIFKYEKTPSILDDYKVEIRRPRRKVIENS